MVSMDVAKVMRVFAQAQSEYQASWQPVHRSIRDFVFPYRGQFVGDLPNRGVRRDQNVYDSKPSRAAKTLAAGLMSGLTSPSRPWFKLGLDDPELEQSGPVARWLEVCTNLLMSVFAKSNMYKCLHDNYVELGVFGSSAVMCVDDYDTVIRGHCLPCGSYMLAADDTGRVNRFFRFVWMTPEQMVGKFGRDNVSQGVRDLYDRSVSQWVRVCQAIIPNDGRVLERKDAQNMEFASLYWEDGQKNLAQHSGFNVFPVLAPRWDSFGSNVYGYGPGWDCLPESKELQRLVFDRLVGLELQMKPPLLLPDEMRSTGVNAVPGGITFYTGANQNDAVRSLYQVQLPFQEMFNAIQGKKADIDEIFFVDLFRMLAYESKTRMTATEVVEKNKERLMLLGPVIENLESELLDPAIDIAFSVLLRAGALPPAPQEIQGAVVKVEYISSLAQAQKLLGRAAVEETVGFIGNLAAQQPQVMDKLDFDAVVDHYANITGLPPSCMASQETVEKIRAQRAEAARKQEQLAQMQQMAQSGMAAVQGAKLMSETPMGGNSALGVLMGGGQ